MKKYIKPIAKEIEINSTILTGSNDGLEDGSQPGNSYDPDAESYSKGSIWQWMGEEE